MQVQVDSAISVAGDMPFNVGASVLANVVTAIEINVSLHRAARTTPKANACRPLRVYDRVAESAWKVAGGSRSARVDEVGEMNDLERFRGTMGYEKVDRAPFYEFMWPAWPETAERWAREGGYVAGQTDFGCDK
jgi:hypothetical protein